MPKETVENLLDQLDASCGAAPSDVKLIAAREVSNAKQFIDNFESCSSASLDSEQRVQLADWSLIQMTVLTAAAVNSSSLSLIG